VAKYIFNGKGIVWDAEGNRPLVHFKNGVFETEDSKTVGKLKKLGYEPAEVIKEKAEAGKGKAEDEEPNGGAPDGDNPNGGGGDNGNDAAG